jgi:hypothetical protein
MASLAPALRKKLEDAVKEARDVAEAGARAALEQLAVHAAEPFAHLSPEDRDLRNRLRARARQLGDGRDTRTGTHEIEHIVVECAYEHWHRMLFARFLAENGVLMANSEALGIENTPVTLEECEELAEDEGAANGWELAGRYASKMLPQIFRPDAPVLAVHLPPERQRRLEQILAELAPETFKASDALGWVYQFWQAKKKEDVNASEAKIGAAELPAVTQLFTENYMVEFLLQNTLGAWWCAAGRTLPLSMPYLHVSGDGSPVGGEFSGWPRVARDVRVLDPCCGSGHFLVAAFEILVAFRIAEERLPARDACDAVLRDNLYGLELDPRCLQLAAFAIALAAWKYPGAGGYRRLPPMNLGCSGASTSDEQAGWLRIAGDNERLRTTLGRIWELFCDAPVLGSLIDVNTLTPDLFSEIGPPLTRALEQIERGSSSNYEIREEVSAAIDVSAAIRIMRERYTLVATNVPFLGLERQSETLARHLKKHFENSKRDLATAFVERCLRYASGSVALVTPGEWTFLRPHRDFREQLLSTKRLNMLCKLGGGAFSYSVRASPVLLVASNSSPASVAYSDVASLPFAEKKLALEHTSPACIQQEVWRRNPDCRIVNPDQSERALPLLAAFADAAVGLSAGDNQRFEAYFWELPEQGSGWECLQSSVSEASYFAGREKVVRWENESGAMARLAESVRHLNHAAQNWRRGKPLWGRHGVAVSLMGELPATIYTGERYDINCCAIVPKQQKHLMPLVAYALSGELGREIRRIDQSLKVGSPKTLLSVPFDFGYWESVSVEQFEDRLPDERSDDCTQWVFGETPRGSRAPLQVAVARLLGYRWPRQPEDRLDSLCDDDGVVCLPSVRGEEAAAARLSNLLELDFGDSWSAKARDALLASAGAEGRGLDWWLRNKFFEQHCQLFQHRPFIWHIWDGIKKDGFGVLVNYHKLDRKLLETLTYTYLGDWIRRQQDDAARNVDGASERLDAARRLQQSLELILEGERPFDIFVRWKELYEQPIGWEPDLNDGIRVNIRPFMRAPDVDKKGAGILRTKPTLHWGKDRGTDHPDSRPPWYELGPVYGEPLGARINDHHLSLVEKRAARERAGGR